MSVRRQDEDFKESTYSEVRRKFRDWHDNRPPARPSRRHYVPSKPMLSPAASKLLFTAIGVGIGLVLLTLSAISFYAARTWIDIARDGASVGYGLVGFFLLIAGFGAILASWNHNYRAASRPPQHH